MARPPRLVLLLFLAGSLLLARQLLWHDRPSAAPAVAKPAVAAATAAAAPRTRPVVVEAARAEAPTEPLAGAARAPTDPPPALPADSEPADRKSAGRKPAAKPAARSEADAKVEAAEAAARRRGRPVLVALNKPVYRFVREREYACPALRGVGCTFTTERGRFGEADAIIDVLKDPRKGRPLDFRTTRGQYKGVIISEQDLAKRHSVYYKRNGYDFEVGYNKKDATIWRPFMCNELNRKVNVTIAEQLLKGPPPAARVPPARRPGELAAFVSNCVGWRLEYLRELRKHVRLDSYGSCLHNNDTCAKSGKRKCNKEERAADYAFVFAFENSEESHYVTEKVYTGLRSGAVPIYKGAPEVLQHVPRGSILHADDFDSPKALGLHLQRLLRDPKAYAAHHAWDLNEFAARETVAQCPWQCRVCEWIARRGAKGAANAG